MLMIRGILVNLMQRKELGSYVENALSVVISTLGNARMDHGGQVTG